MGKEYFSYSPLAVSTDISSSHSDMGVVQPDMASVRNIYSRTAFAASERGRQMSAVGLRGSTAALLDSDGTVHLRGPSSDIDFFAVSENDGKSAYYVEYQALDERSGNQTEIDTLMVPAALLAEESHSAARSFYSSKLVHPTWTLAGEEVMDAQKLTAGSTFIRRGAARRGIRYLTPSGASRLLIEENLYAEPWRWTSLLTHYVQSPHAQRQRHLLTHLADNVLQHFARTGEASDRTKQFRSSEPVYEIASDSRFLLPGRAMQLYGVLLFLLEQARIPSHPRTACSRDTLTAVGSKFRSLLSNPTLRYDAQIIFSR